MKTIQLEQNLAVRLPHWTHCVVEVCDIGQHSFWGVLRDIKTNIVIDPIAVFPINLEWQLALDAKTILDLI